MKKRSWSLLWIGFIIIGVIYLFIWGGCLGAIIGFGMKVFEAIQYHIKRNTALLILALLYVIYNEIRRIK